MNTGGNLPQQGSYFDHLPDCYKMHYRTEASPEMHDQDDEEEERRLTEQLANLRDETRRVIEESWAQVERLQNQESETSQRIAELERELANALNMAYNEDENPAWPGDASVSTEASTDDDILRDILNELKREHKERIDEMSHDLRAKEHEIEELQQRNAQQEETLYELQDELEQLQQNAGGGSAEDLEFLEKEIIEKDIQVNELHEEVEKAETEYQRAHTVAAELNRELVNINVQIDAEMQETGADVASLRAQIEQNEAEVKVLTKRQEDLTQETDEILQDLRHELSSAYPEEYSDDSMADLWKEFDLLQEKEKELGNLLVARLNEQRTLSEILERTTAVSQEAGKSLSYLQDILDKYSTHDDDDSADLNFAPRRTGKESVEEVLAIQTNMLQTLKMVEEELTARLQFLEGMNLELAQEFETKQPCERVGDTFSTMLSDSDAFSAQDIDRLNDSISSLTSLTCRARSMIEETTDGIIDRKRGDSDGDAELEYKKVEEELEKRCAQVATLEETLKKQDSTVSNLRAALVKVETKAQKESKASVKLMEQLQSQVQSVLTRLNDKEVMIEQLAKVYEERKASESALSKELRKLQKDTTKELVGRGA